MPEINSRMITRDDLMRVFNQTDEACILYICAPAGYGKTVSVRQWLESKCEYGQAIVSLDEYDNNIPHFCRRFCSALLACQPGNPALKKLVSHPAFESAPDEFAIHATDALLSDKHAVLVLDDLHCVTDKQTLRLALILLKRLPESFQIVLASRSEPPDVFSALWAGGRLTRITAEQLRLTREEIKRIYENRAISITRKQADDIYRFTDGWPIGVNALLISGGEPSGESLKILEDFIRTSIWERWDEDTREFMIRTSILRELLPPLCAALTDDADCEKRLDRLVEQNTFVSRAKKGVYRYHHLFQDFLNNMRYERGEEFTRALLERAGNWYWSQQDFYNAIDCFIQCENHDGIAKCFGLLVTAGREYFLIDQLLSVASLSMIERVAAQHPYIYSILAWAAFNEGHAGDMERYTDLYYANQDEIVRLDPRLALNIMLVRLIDFRSGLYELASLLGQVHTEPAENKLSELGVSIGTVNQNMPLLHRGTRDFSECATGDVEVNIAGLRLALGGLFGEEAFLFADCLTAGLLYEQGYLEKAHCYALAANAKIKRESASESKLCAMTVLVYVLDALGEENEAEHTLKHIEEMIAENDAYYLNYNFNALITRRKLGKGDMDAARGWLSHHDTALYNEVDFYKLYGHMTTSRAYITRGDYSSAIILLSKTLELAQTYNRPLDIIEAQILLSIAYWKKKRGFQNDAMLHLKQAVSLAYRFGYTQMFINEGAELAALLRRLQKRVEQSREKSLPASFVKMLYLKTLECQNEGLTSGQPPKRVAYTDKQKNVMKLLCEGKSYKEIAEHMNIKHSTLRSHIALIYKKLEVTSETDAVLKIKSTGILD